MAEQHAPMRPVLCIDINPTTQAVLFLQTDREFAEMPRLVLPSPSVVFSHKVAQCTAERRDIYVTGPAMGRECVPAFANHVRQGCRVAMDKKTASGLYKTVAGATAAGIDICKFRPAGYTSLVTGEIDMAFWGSFARKLGLEEPSLVAVCAMDSGVTAEVAPSGNASRGSIMHVWTRVLRLHAENGAPPGAFMLSDVPAYLPRLTAIQATTNGLVTDTGVAALLGMLRGEEIRASSLQQGIVLLHAGEVHATAILVWRGRIFGVYEQHIFKMDVAAIMHDLSEFRLGLLSDEAVRNAGGHGAAFADIPLEAKGFPLLFIAGKERRRFAGYGTVYKSPEGGVYTGCLGMAAAIASMDGSGQ